MSQVCRVVEEWQPTTSTSAMPCHAMQCVTDGIAFYDDTYLVRAILHAPKRTFTLFICGKNTHVAKLATHNLHLRDFGVGTNVVAVADDVHFLDAVYIDMEGLQTKA